MLLLLALAFVDRLMGDEFGITVLIFHEDWHRQLIAGASFGILWLHALYIGYLCWLRDHRSRQEFNEPKHGRILHFTGYAWRNSVCILVSSLGLFALLKFLQVIARISGVRPLFEAGEIGFRLLPWLGDRLAFVLGFVLLTAFVWAHSRARVMQLFARVPWWSVLDALDQVRQRAVRSAEPRDLHQPRPTVDDAIWRVLRIIGLIAIVVSWAATVVLALISASSGLIAGLFAGALCAVLGTVVFVTLRNEHPRGFVLLLWLHAVLTYVIVTFSLARHGWIAASIIAVVVPFLLLVFQCLALPVAAAHVFDQWVENYRKLGIAPRERMYQQRAFVFLPMAMLFFVVCRTSFLSSAVPVVCFVFFIAILAYGIATYLIRRTLPVLLGAMFVAALIGGIAPYKYRFDEGVAPSGKGLDYEHKSLMHIEEELKNDQKRAKAFRHAYQEFRDANQVRDRMPDLYQQAQGVLAVEEAFRLGVLEDAKLRSDPETVAASRTFVEEYDRKYAESTARRSRWSGEAETT
jgi:hypothetical protein